MKTILQETSDTERASASNKAFQSPQQECLSLSVCCVLIAYTSKKQTIMSEGKRIIFPLKALLCFHTHMTGSEEQLTASLGCIDTSKKPRTQTKAEYMEPNHQINENSYCDWVSRNPWNKGHSAPHTLPLFFSCSCFPLAIHLQSEGKTFQLSAAKYRSNLERFKWLHCEALKGSKEEKSRRVRGSWRLMTPVHWRLEVTKSKEKRGRHSILQETEQTFHWWWSGLCCELLWLCFNYSFTQREINR